MSKGLTIFIILCVLGILAGILKEYHDQNKKRRLEEHDKIHHHGRRVHT
jgi:hypothetical protein